MNIKNVSILNAIKQFKSADEMKRRKGNENTPVKGLREFEAIEETINEIPNPIFEVDNDRTIIKEPKPTI